MPNKNHLNRALLLLFVLFNLFTQVAHAGLGRWTEVKSLPNGSQITNVMTDQSGNVYAIFQNSILKSSINDGLNNWVKADTGLPLDNTTQIKPVYGNPSDTISVILSTVTNGSKIYSTNDHAQTWFFVKDLNSNQVYNNIVTDSKGISYRNFPSGTDPTGVIHYTGSVQKSTDNGSTWTNIGNLYNWSGSPLIAIDSKDNVYVNIKDTPNAISNTIFQVSNAGATIKKLNIGDKINNPLNNGGNVYSGWGATLPVDINNNVYLNIQGLGLFTYTDGAIPLPSTITLTCPQTISIGSTQSCSSIVKYSDGVSYPISNVNWTSSNPTLLSIKNNDTKNLGTATLTLSSDTNSTATISASFTENNVTVTGSTNITVAQNAVDNIVMTCPNNVNIGDVIKCSTIANYTNGTSKPISPTLSTDPTYVSVNNGTLTALNTTYTVKTNISASYTENNITKQANATITVQGIVPSNITTEISGTNSNLNLMATIDLQNTISMGKNVNSYAIAVVPQLNNAVLALSLNGSWSTSINPYTSSNAKASKFFLPILKGNMDVSGLVGTMFYAGYGADVNDMINNGQYKLVYTIH